MRFQLRSMLLTTEVIVADIPEEKGAAAPVGMEVLRVRLEGRFKSFPFYLRSTLQLLRGR